MPVTLETYNPAKLEPAEYPQDARIDAMQLAPSTTYARGTVLGKITATNKGAAYDNSLTNGVGTAVAILVYDVITDADGNHYLGTNAVASSVNLPHKDASVYVAGVFDTDDLTGWDSNAATDLHARTLPSGYVRIP
jgi:hypothetical protein